MNYGTVVLITYLFTMYLLRKWNFNFSYVLHVIRELKGKKP